MRPLSNTVALVTGATRGAGKGIALALGDAGATVYVTGRSTRGAPSADGFPGTIEDTAEAVTARGGRGVPVRCDHGSEEEVEELFQRVEREQGRLDLLVNNAWRGHDGYRPEGFTDDGQGLVAPFWKKSLGHWDRMMGGGPRLALLTTKHAVPLLMRTPGARVVCTTFWARGAFTGDLYYDLAKATIVRLVFGMAEHLKPHNVPVVGVSPGWMRTELVLLSLEPKDYPKTESTLFVGRAVAALASEPDLMARTGQVLQVADLAEEYGFTDEDGRRPRFTLDA